MAVDQDHTTTPLGLVAGATAWARGVRAKPETPSRPYGPQSFYSRVRTGIESMAVAALGHTSLPEALLRQRARRRLTVLAYHRIHPIAAADYPFDTGVISAAAEEFTRELQYVQRHLDVISLRELADGFSDPRQLPKRPAIITFDDGYWDNYEIAYPILKDLGLPACFFVITGLVGTHQVPWWDQVACCMKHSRTASVSSPFHKDDPPYLLSPAHRDAAQQRFLRNLKTTPWSRALDALQCLREETAIRPEAYLERPMFMSWQHIREMQAGGMEIGGHTRTHPVLSNIEERAQLRNEILGCYTDLRTELGRDPLAFAYPIGLDSAMSPSVDRQIREHGFQLTFSYVHARASLRREAAAPRIPRVPVEYGQNHNRFRLGMALAPNQC